MAWREDCTGPGKEVTSGVPENTRQAVLRPRAAADGAPHPGRAISTACYGWAWRERLVGRPPLRCRRHGSVQADRELDTELRVLDLDPPAAEVT